MPLDVSKRGTLDRKDPPLKAIVAANDNYEAGYHAGDAGGLDAVDTGLATGNIKNGITIFGKAGSADVRDISDADLVVAEAPTGKFFYAGGGARKTGSGTKTLNPANETVAAGYYAATTLSAVDAQLAAGNIKSGITIFGFTGPATVQDISDADLTVAEAPTGKFFYAVTGGRKTGTGTKTLNPVNEDVAAGYYGATTLSAVDGDLAAGNIKDGVTIFGFLGTFVGGALAEDITGFGDATAVSDDASGGSHTFVMADQAEQVIATTTDTFAAGSLAVAVGSCSITVASGSHYTRLYMGGVLVATSAPFAHPMANITLVATRALSGSQTCDYRLFNDSGSSKNVSVCGGPGDSAGNVGAVVGVGSVELA